MSNFVHLGAALLACTIVPARTEIVYCTNIDTAFAIASNDTRTVVLYTGNSSHCSTETPRGYFEHRLLPKYPQLGLRSNLYAFCEQFSYLPPKTPSNELNRAWFAEQAKFDSLYQKYFIPTFYPTLTFINSSGRRLNGPFWTFGGDECSGNIDNYYETLSAYLADEQPMNRERGRSNLVKAVFSTDMDKPVFGLFRCLQHTNGGAEELLMGMGATSREFEVREPFHFAVRDIQHELRDGLPWGEYQYGSSVAVAGHFKDSEPFTGLFLARLNGAWFRAWMNDSDKTLASGLTAGKLSLKRGEHFFYIFMLDDSVALALIKQIEQLRSADTFSQPQK